MKGKRMKQRFNLHTHTWRCGHAQGEDREYIENAILQGFQCLGFSEHIQYRIDKGRYNRIDYEDFVEYFDDIRVLKKEYKEEIEILCGLEAAYVPEAMDDLLGLKPLCDFILLGHHQGGLNVRKYNLRCNEAEMDFYAEEIVCGIKSGYYDIVAHPDFFMKTRTYWNEKCESCAYKICTAAKNYNIPLELNIKGAVSELKGLGYPYRKFWEIAAKVGNEVLYGWDAHNPKDILWTTDKVDAILNGIELKWLHKWK